MRRPGTRNPGLETRDQRLATRGGLALLLLLYFGFAVTYARSVPTWQAPDEPAHYNYVRHLAEGRGLPVLQAGDYDQAYLARLTSEHFPATLPVDALRYESHQPPLYYLLMTPVDLATGDSPVATRVVLLRLTTALLGLPLLALAYAATRLVAPALALAATAFVALVPQHLATLASVNNDVLGELGVTAILYLVLRLKVRDESTVGSAAVPAAGGPEARAPRPALQGGSHLQASALLGALAGGVLLAKTTAYVGLALIPLGLLLAAAGPAARRLRQAVRQSSLASLAALFLAGWWFARNMIEYGWTDPTGQARHDLVVAGQPAYAAFGWDAVSYFLAVTFRSFWAQIGWMAVPADESTYVLLGLVSGAAALGLAACAWRAARRRAVPVWGPGLWVSGVTLGLVAGALVAYNFRFIQPQGRYLFPALLPLALFFALGISVWTGRRLAPWLALPLVAGLALLNLQVLARMVPLLR